ncbi:MAG: transglutaminase family protein [Paracoccaceae bacterium]
MILTILHSTRYDYGTPARSVVQSHRLTPSVFDGQRVVSWQVEVTGGRRGGEFRDGAGDLVTGWTIPGPVDAVEVRVQGVVETADLTGVLKGHRETVAPGAYLRQTPATAPDGALRDLAAGVAEADPLALAHGLASAVGAAVLYRPGVTHAATTATEALAQGEGVCQDHAQVLVALARLRGLPARYVSGYLSSTRDGSAEEAAHAWAEIHVPGFGWIGFDPANRCCPDGRYLRLGSGLDAKAAAPIRGIARGAGEEQMSVTVAVQAQEQ